MREHAHLPAMVRFVGQHVAQHLRTNRLGPGPTVSHELLYASLAAQCFGQHLRAASGALCRSRTNLTRRAPRSIQLRRNLQVRRRQPYPLRADIVHVRKDRRNRADVAGWLRARRRIKMLGQHLVHAIVGGKHPDRSLSGSA